MRSIKEREGTYMKSEEYKQNIIRLVGTIEDEETLLFILELIKRLKD